MKEKLRKNICAFVFVFAMFVLIGTGTEDLTVFIVKNTLSAGAMLLSAVIGKFNEEDTDEKADTREPGGEERDMEPEQKRRAC